MIVIACLLQPFVGKRNFCLKTSQQDLKTRLETARNFIPPPDPQILPSLLLLCLLLHNFISLPLTSPLLFPPRDHRHYNSSVFTITADTTTTYKCVGGGTIEFGNFDGSCENSRLVVEEELVTWLWWWWLWSKLCNCAEYRD